MAPPPKWIKSKRRPCRKPKLILNPDYLLYLEKQKSRRQKNREVDKQEKAVKRCRPVLASLQKRFKKVEQEKNAALTTVQNLEKKLSKALRKESACERKVDRSKRRADRANLRTSKARKALDKAQQAAQDSEQTWSESLEKRAHDLVNLTVRTLNQGWEEQVSKAEQRASKAEKAQADLQKTAAKEASKLKAELAEEKEKNKKLKSDLAEERKASQKWWYCVANVAGKPKDKRFLEWLARTPKRLGYCRGA